MITSLVESMRWAVVALLPIVMEPDSLARNVAPQLADAAATAINYFASHVRSHSIYLEVQVTTPQV
jgi:hypothetical protein